MDERRKEGRKREREREEEEGAVSREGFFRGQKKVAHLRNARVRVRGRFADKGNS